MTATVQVHVAAPVPLLIRTDVLPQLGFQFLQKDRHECQNLLKLDRDPSDPGPSTKQHSEGGTRVLAEQDATVRLLQATRLPPRHAKLVRVHTSCSQVPSTSLFSPDPVVRMDESLQIQESVVEPDSENHFVILVENHTCAPVTLNEGDALGTLHGVQLPDVVGDPSVSRPGAEEADRQQQLPQVARVVAVGQSAGDREQQLREVLKVDHEHLSEDYQHQLEELVVEYQDVFSLNPLDIGSTNVISHHIDTGEQPPIKQAACKAYPFCSETAD